MQALCKAVLAIAGRASSAASLAALLHLSTLSTTTANTASAAHVEGALAGIVLWGSAVGAREQGQQQTSEQQHLAALAATLAGCTEAQLTTLAAIVQRRGEGRQPRGRRGGGAAGRTAALVQCCYAQVHEQLQGLGDSGAAKGGGSGGMEEQLEAIGIMLKGEAKEPAPLA